MDLQNHPFALFSKPGMTMFAGFRHLRNTFRNWRISALHFFRDQLVLSCGYAFSSFFFLLNIYSKNKMAPLQGTEHDFCSGTSTLDAGGGGHANERCIEGQPHPGTTHSSSSANQRSVHMHVNAPVEFQVSYHSIKDSFPALIWLVQTREGEKDSVGFLQGFGD